MFGAVFLVLVVLVEYLVDVGEWRTSGGGMEKRHRPGVSGGQGVRGFSFWFWGLLVFDTPFFLNRF